LRVTDIHESDDSLQAAAETAKLTILTRLPEAEIEDDDDDDLYNDLGGRSIVLATVPGYPAAVRVWNRTGCSSPGCDPENRGNHRVRGRVGTGPRFPFMVPTSLAPIK